MSAACLIAPRDRGCRLYNAVARCMRKVSRARPFNRQRAARPLLDLTRKYWLGSDAALFAYLGYDDGWDKIQRHVQLASVAKSLSDADRTFFSNLLASFGYFADAPTKADAVLRATSFGTFEAAAKYALGQLGVRSAEFDLRNERIREALIERKSAALFATRSHMDGVFRTIIDNFYDLGRNPYNQEFLDGLKDTLGYQTDWEAKRFSLTETGIAAELGQLETYKRNGVQRKQWNTLEQDSSRASHLELNGVAVGIDESFDVGGSAASHPLDPRLPAAELINCHCWLSPVVDDDFQLDPSRIWEGQ